MKLSRFILDPKGYKFIKESPNGNLIDYNQLNFAIGNLIQEVGDIRTRDGEYISDKLRELL